MWKCNGMMIYRVFFDVLSIDIFSTVDNWANFSFLFKIFFLWCEIVLRTSIKNLKLRKIGKIRTSSISQNFDVLIKKRIWTLKRRCNNVVLTSSNGCTLTRYGYLGSVSFCFYDKKKTNWFKGKPLRVGEKMFDYP